MPTINDNLVVKSNELIQASYAMTLNEQRLLLACISQIDSRKVIEQECTFTLGVEQARDLFYTRGDQRHAYRDLQDASERLFERKVRISLPNNKELLTRFVQSVRFDPDNGEIEIRFAYEIKPYLSQLEKNFTKYRLNNVVRLTSTYAIRIYELLVCWSGQNQFFKEMEIKEFRELLGLDGKYRQFGELKKRVIEPAVEQINESTDYEISVGFKKSRRTYKWVQLSFNRKASAAAAEAKRTAEKQLQHSNNIQAKNRRLQHQAAAVTDAITASKTTAVRDAMNSIPDHAEYVNTQGMVFVKYGMFFEGDNCSIPANMALDMIKSGDLKVVE